jgi:basic membrane protein A and related proteins
MKRSLGLLIVIVSLVAVGCGGGGDESSGGTTTTSTSAGASMKIGLVTDIGGLNDRGFNHLSYLGLQRAQRELGVQGRVYQAKSTQEYVPNLSTFARQGYDLTIGVGFTEATAIDTAATNFSDANFAIVDVDVREEPHKPKNLLGLLFREQETGYLVGYLAGMVEKQRPGKDVIGYQAGAKAANPGITLLNTYSEDFADQAKCKQIALNQIELGAGVIFQVAGGCGLGALDAAKEKGVWGIGVDADQAFLGPHILTSAVKGVDTAVFLAIKSVVDGEFKGGTNMTFGLKQNGVGVGKISSKVPKADVDKLNQIRADIISGKIKNIPTEVQQ